ncbi:hypothetical protein E2C01_096726 [Portunus trituberculatus]|uniref:Uncharacterized protein n=1 Tax=Portunus trituberculatus TaxID=210409 RepID=A0A5B7K7K8_PORTR|nr:hypothetical protein [Portunus trituberculatus]
MSICGCCKSLEGRVGDQAPVYILSGQIAGGSRGLPSGRVATCELRRRSEATHGQLRRPRCDRGAPGGQVTDTQAQELTDRHRVEGWEDLRWCRTK